MGIVPSNAMESSEMLRCHHLQPLQRLRIPKLSVINRKYLSENVPEVTRKKTRMESTEYTFFFYKTLSILNCFKYS